MKLCYIILIHHRFEQAARLLRRLQSDGVRFVVHVDRRASQTDFAAFRRLVSGLPVVYAQRVKSRWGSYQLAVAIMNCIRTVVHEVVDFDRCIILSGQDYPIAREQEIVDFFRADTKREYFEGWPLELGDEAKSGWTPHFRFRRFHVWLGDKRIALPWLRKPASSLPLFYGSGWWALTREALKYVDEAFRARAAYRRMLRTSFLVDEVCVPTLLMNSRFAADCANCNVTLTEFTSTSGPHPKTWRREDLPALLSSPKLFARKFDESLDPEILDELDVACIDARAHGTAGHENSSSATRCAAAGEVR